MFKKILIAIDKSAPSMSAVNAASQMATQLGAQCALLHVVDPSLAYIADLGTTNENELAHLRVAGDELIHSIDINAARFVLEGDPADTIINTARDWDADLIVLGSDSRGRLAHFLLGSTADSVIRRAPCPVLTVRAHAERVAQLDFAAHQPITNSVTTSG
jgi:nucleotide-binding universal stress UspA family protein